jgi:hypothetical protein
VTSRSISSNKAAPARMTIAAAAISIATRVLPVRSAARPDASRTTRISCWSLSIEARSSSNRAVDAASTSACPASGPLVRTASCTGSATSARQAAARCVTCCSVARMTSSLRSSPSRSPICLINCCSAATPSV